MQTLSDSDQPVLSPSLSAKSEPSCHESSDGKELAHHSFKALGTKRRGPDPSRFKAHARLELFVLPQ